MTAFVISSHQLVVVIHDTSALLRAGDYTVNGLVNRAIINQVGI